MQSSTLLAERYLLIRTLGLHSAISRLWPGTASLLNEQLNELNELNELNKVCI